MQIHLQKCLSIIYIHSSLQLLQHDNYCPGQQQVGTRMSSKERCATLMQTDILMLRFQENLYSTWVIMSGSFKRGSSRLICLGLLSTSGYYRCLFVFVFLFVACCLKSVIRIYFTFLLTYIFQFNAVVLIALILMPILKIFSSVLFFFATDPKSTSGLFTSATQKNRSIGLWSRWSSQKYVCCPSQWLMTRVITTKDKTGIRI